MNKENCWISVKDRLPEQDGKYLTSFYDHEPEVALFKNGKFHFWELNMFETMEWCPTTYVSHWMPLPEPPKEDDIL